MSFGCCCCVQIPQTHVNATEVDNYVTTGSPPSTIYPYPRPDSITEAGTCGGTDEPLCNEWPRADFPTAAGTGQTLHQRNLYEAGTDTGIESCRAGHKIVQAELPWVGRNPFNFCTGDCAEITTRYRTLTISIQGVLRATDTPCDLVSVYDEERVYTVAKNSGMVALASCTSNSRQVYKNESNEWVDGDPITLSDIDDYRDTGCAGADPTLYAYLKSQSNNISDSFTFSATEISWSVLNATADLCPSSDPYMDAGLFITEQMDFSMVLSDEYTVAAVTSECEALLDEWALNAESQLPWRGDSYRALGVMVRTDGVYNTPDIWTACDWEDTNEYTGDVLGIPFPSGWPDKSFSWNHRTWNCDGGSTWTVHFYGASSGTNAAEGIDNTDTLMPTTATQWTENYYAGLWPQGNWVMYDQNEGMIRMQKTVEASIPFARHNFFEPCGAQRWMMDTGKASCVSTYSGTDDFVEGDALTLEADLSASIAAGDLVAIYGCTNGPKVFEVDTISGLVVTLGPQTVSPEGIADTYADWDAAYADPVNSGADPGFGILGKLRWPDSAAGLKGAICGRIRITSATQNGGDLDLVLASAATYLRTGDKIQFITSDTSDTLLDNNSGAGYTVTVTDSTHITIASLTLDNAKHTDALKSFGAPLSSWNTTTARGDFVIQTWADDAATGTFETTSTNTDASKTGKGAIACTPNLDASAGWYEMAFPDAPTITECGAATAVIAVQGVIDPLWQAPLACTGSLTVCPDYVEAMTDAKITTISAPALPSGTSFDDMLPGVPAAAGNDCASHQPNAHFAPWNPC